MAFVDVSRENIACEEEQRGEMGEMEMSGAAGDGRWREDRPSGELVSTMLTRVWAIAGMYVYICVGGLSKAGGAVAEYLTGSHMSGDLLRMSESRLADEALVISGHHCVALRGGCSCS